MKANSINFIEEVLGKNITRRLIKNLLHQDALPLEKKMNIWRLVAGHLLWKCTYEGYDFWRDVNVNIENFKDAYIPFTITEKDLEDYKNSLKVTPEKEQQSNKKEKTMIAAFTKGKFNIKAVVHQLAKGAKEDRPFVLEALKEEYHRVLKKYSASDKAKLLFSEDPVKSFNLRYAGLKKHITYFLTKLSNLGEPNSIRIAIFLTKAYKFEKFTTLKSQGDYTWIKKYLTQENLQKEEVVMFKSNKITITLLNGNIMYVDKKLGELYIVPVKMNKAGEFYI